MGTEGPSPPVAADAPAVSNGAMLMRPKAQQDAFDKDDFDAVAYINEMFPTGKCGVSQLVGSNAFT